MGENTVSDKGNSAPSDTLNPGPGLSAPAWLSEHRVTIPGRVNEYLKRPELTKRGMPTNRPLTLFKAPGGFGKTTELAECCRALVRRGVLTAWLVLDDRDDPATLDTYLAYAFQRAGLDILEALQIQESGASTPGRRVELLLQALRRHGGPCVLALDELERVSHPESVALLNALANSSVPGLHVAMTCRKLPAGLDIQRPVFEGATEVLSAEDLRFSRQEIQAFFHARLSVRQLAAVTRESSGWPIALRIYRNSSVAPTEDSAGVVREVVKNWVETRLFRDLSADDREILLDVGLLDWIDAELLDEVLETTNAISRLHGMSSLTGLLESIRGGARKVWRLHPLIREHCVERRRRETPERYRSIHRRIAIVLARRGKTVDAMRHAAEAGDGTLTGQILTDAGGLGFWLREGTDRLLAADRFVTEETLARFPRLMLVRAIARGLQGWHKEARRAIAAALPILDTVESGDDARLDIDRCLTQGMLVRMGCETVGSQALRAVLVNFDRTLNLPGLDPVIRSTLEYGLAMAHEMKAEFPAALALGKRARRRVGGRSDYLAMILDFHLGQIAMAQGHVANAADCYRQGLKAAKRRFLQDPGLATHAEVLMRELDLERNRITDEHPGTRAPGALWRRSPYFGSHAAASGVAAELTLERHGVDAALSRVDEMWDNAHRAELPALVRYLAGLRVGLLALAGWPGEAQEAWQADGLPPTDEECLDLERLSWRELEVLACARLRLLVELGAFDAGRQFARDLIGLTAERGLKRTHMRALPLAIVLEERDGERSAAMDHLVKFLRLHAKTDYSRALVREAATTTPLLTQFLDTHPQSPLHGSATALLAASTAGEATNVPTLSKRERQILELFGTHTDKRIAAALSLTPAGVRYHNRRLFAKLKVHSRHEAARRARALGLLEGEH